jgi:hypothetical protein
MLTVPVQVSHVLRDTALEVAASRRAAESRRTHESNLGQIGLSAHSDAPD